MWLTPSVREFQTTVIHSMKNIVIQIKKNNFLNCTCTLYKIRLCFSHFNFLGYHVLVPKNSVGSIFQSPWKEGGSNTFVLRKDVALCFGFFISVMCIAASTVASVSSFFLYASFLKKKFLRTKTFKPLVCLRALKTFDTVPLKFCLDHDRSELWPARQYRDWHAAGSRHRLPQLSQLCRMVKLQIRTRHAVKSEHAVWHLKVPSGQIRSALAWYHWKCLGKDINRCRI